MADPDGSHLPAIEEDYNPSNGNRDSEKFDAYESNRQNTQDDRLPAITVSTCSKKIVRQPCEVILTENKAVIGSSDSRIVSTRGSQPQLPSEWTTQRVNMPDGPLKIGLKATEDASSRSKMGWDNQIAKHILSLYATRRAVSAMDESKALLEFMDSRRQGQDGTFQATAPPLNASQMKVLETLQNAELEEKKKKKVKKKVKKIGRQEVNTEHPFQIRNLKSSALNSEDDARINRVRLEREWVTTVLDKVKEDLALKKDDYGDKYRKNSVIKTKEGKDIIVRGQAKAYPIWFVSSGGVYSDWTRLPGGKKLQAQLNVMYENKQFTDYVGVLENLLITEFRDRLYGTRNFKMGSFGITSPYTTLASEVSISNKKTKKAGKKKPTGSSSSSSGGDGGVGGGQDSTRASGGQKEDTLKETGDDGFFGDSNFWDNIKKEEGTFVDPEPKIIELPELRELWLQLVVTTNALGMLSVENESFTEAMTLLKQAESFATNEEFLNSKSIRRELQAHVKDAMAYFFFRKGKGLAAMAFAQQALESYEKSGNVEAIGACLLHIGAGHSQQGEHKEAHRILFQFLSMVDSGRLGASQDAEPKQLCLVAIGYHNLAVAQLKLQLPDLAAKNSLNARKIARLCLSYSNRWLHVFQYTHEIAIADVKYELASKNALDMTPEQLTEVKHLAEIMYDPITLQEASS